jgi:hypothetical protein
MKSYLPQKSPEACLSALLDGRMVSAGNRLERKLLRRLFHIAGVVKSLFVPLDSLQRRESEIAGKSVDAGQMST